MNIKQYKLTVSAMLWCLALALTGFGQTVSEKLPIGQPLEREIKGGETHGYKINLKTGEFLRVRVEQRGVDVVVRLRGADGKLLIERDRPNGSNGEESLAAELSAAGEYLVEVAALEKDAPVGKYNITSDAPRQSTAADKRRITAETGFQEAMKLCETKTAESQRKALAQYEEVLSAWQFLKDDYAEALTLTTMAFTESALGENEAAKPRLVLAFRKAEALKNESLVGEIKSGLRALAKIYDDAGFESFRAGTLESRRAAVEQFKNASALYRETGDKAGEAFSQLVLGKIADDFGEKAQALNYYNQSLLLFRWLQNKLGEATTLNNIGLVYYALGERQKALEFYNQALPLRRAVGDKDVEAITLNEINKVYDDLGSKQKAVEFFNQALSLLRAVGGKGGEAYTLANIGAVYYALGEKQKALEYFNQALPFFRVIGDKHGEAYTLNNIGEVNLVLGDKQKALDFYNQALLLRREVGDKRGEAITLKNIGLVYFDLGDKARALENFQAALPLSKFVGDKSAQAVTLDWLMFYWNGLKSPRFAIFYGKQSINIYQELRQDINSLDKETQKTYLKSIEKSYRFLADILIAEGRIAEAEEVLAMLKEEEFFAYLRRDDKVAAELKGKISLSADERKAFEDYEKYADDITRRAAEFGVLEKKMNDLPQGAKLSNTDQAEYDRLKKDYDAAVTVFGKFLDDLKIRFGTADKRVAVVESSTQNILRELKQPRTVIISTIAGEDRLNLIVTTTDIRRAHTVNISAADLNKLVADFRAAVKNPAVDPRPLGKKLYDTLFPAALAKDLDNIKADTIVWSLDGTLRYAPMAALWDGKNYLAERYTNAVLTLAVLGNLNQPRTSRADWRALGVGVSKAFQNFSALPAVPQELCSVIRDPQKKDFCRTSGAKRAGVIDGLMLSDEEFTLQTFQNELGKVPVIHIASHFSLNAGDESDSFLLLGGGAERRFSLVSLKKKRLDKVELLTLSACNTAMTAGNNSSGVEVEGFGALAQNQGAKSVLATLWAVADDSTRDLMTEFYGELEKNPAIGKAEALRKAQIKLINGNYKTEDAAQKRGTEIIRFDGNADNLPKYTKDPDAPFAHPYFWSPFILFGNWK